MQRSRDTTSRFYDEVATCRERCISARRLPPNKPFPLGERCAGHFDPARSTPTDHRMPILYGTLRVGAAGSVLASFMCLPRLMGKATAVAPVPISTRRGSPLRNRRRGWWYYHDRHPPADHLG